MPGQKITMSADGFKELINRRMKMAVTQDQLIAKKQEVAQKQLAAVQAQNAATAARNAMAVAQGEMQELQAQKAVEDVEAQS